MTSPNQTPTNTQTSAGSSRDSNPTKPGAFATLRGLRTFWFGAVGFVLAIPALIFTLGDFQRDRSEPLPVFGQLPSFEFTDQDERPFSLATMEGKVHIANFIFTTCPTVCPALSRRMNDIQERTRDLDALHLVSFTVDPDYDTPEVLKEFGSRFGQDTSRWSMVTGPLEEVEKTVTEGFKVGMEHRTIPGAKPGTMEVDIVHGEHFVLVDQQGRIRGYYRADDEGENRLLRDARRLVRSGPGV